MKINNCYCINGDIVSEADSGCDVTNCYSSTVTVNNIGTISGTNGPISGNFNISEIANGVSLNTGNASFINASTNDNSGNAYIVDPDFPQEYPLLSVFRNTFLWTGYTNYNTVPTFNISVPTTPTDIILSNTDIFENQPVGTLIGTLTTTDDDLPSDTHTYSLVTNPSSAFEISGNQLLSNTIFDYETQTSYNIRIKTTDSTDLSFEKDFTINVIDVNEGGIVEEIKSNRIYQFNSNQQDITSIISVARVISNNRLQNQIQKTNKNFSSSQYINYKKLVALKKNYYR